MRKYFTWMMYLAVILILAVYYFVAYAGNMLKNCPPNAARRPIVNNVVEVSTDYDELKKVNVMTLSLDAKRQLLNTIAVYDHCDEKSKIKFITEFPNTFQKFFEIFQPHEFTRFDYAIDTIFKALEFVADEYPQQSVSFLVSLSSEAKYDADAPAELQYIFTNFFIKYPDLTIAKIKQLSISKQKNIASFLADVEAIEDYPEYESILNALKSRHETRLYNMFLEAKKNKIAELKRERV